MTTTDPALKNEHTCRNCGNRFTGMFCNQCGEKIFSEKNKRIIHFFEDFFHFLTHFEGTFFTTLKTIIGKPGKISTDYCNGIRKKYFRPQSFFLLLVLIYLIFPYFEGLNMKMYFYTTNDWYGNFAVREIKEAMISTKLTEQQLSLVFHQKAEKVSKFLLYIIVPLSALFFYAVFRKKRKYFYDHMVYAAEVNCIYLLWGFLVLPLIIYIVNRLVGSIAFFQDNFFGILNSTILSVYIFISSRRFYTLKIWQALLLTILFLFFHMIIVHLIYKFVLFVIVINQIN